MRRINLKKANVARADTIRYINRQIVLNYVREKEPISRAEISHETLLQRSTVSLIVDELKTQGLIYESKASRREDGRRRLFRLRAAGYMTIGADVGTAQTTVAVADLVGRVVDKEMFETNPDVTVNLSQIISVRPEVHQNSHEHRGHWRLRTWPGRS